MIDLTKNSDGILANAKHFKKLGIKLPTFKMMIDPENNVPGEIQNQLKDVGLWDINPLNLYRISWKNERKDKGGLYGMPNYIKIPGKLFGIKANILALSGRWFPTGAHKVGATFGCLAPRLVTGQYLPGKTKAVWPSTGNYCRGGAYVSALLGCKSIAILPEEMSAERFEWLKQVAGEVIATPGCESNVKEIFDKCWELKKSGEDLQIFNQFDELGNPLWHYNVTGRAIDEIVAKEVTGNGRLAGAIFSSGSAGTLGAGYYLKDKYPKMKIGAAEALQCPTLMYNGFGGHRIEGIGDKHIPWIHDAKEIDFNIAVDDEQTMRLLRLFNEGVGHEVLKANGFDQEFIDLLNLIGISGLGNIIASVKFAKYNELTEDDYVVTVLTDSMQLYGSRVKELETERGAYTTNDAYKDLELASSVAADHIKELNYYDRKAVHNLKYFTWIEQQEKDLAELNAQWSDHSNYWRGTFDEMANIDEMINEFNELVDKQ